MNLENASHEAINPENIWKHLAILDSLMNKYNIKHPTRIFYLDESSL